MLQETIAIAWKDLISEFRVKYIINSMMIFSLMVIIIFNFIFYNTDFEIEIIISAVLWVTVIFSGTIGLSRSFISETNNNCLDGLLLCPVERSSIYLGKIISNLIFIFLIEFISLVIIIILFNYDISSKLIVLLPVIIIGTIGFVIVGALLSAIAVYSKGKDDYKLVPAAKAIPLQG